MERRTASGLAAVEAQADGTFVLRVDGSPQSLPATKPVAVYEVRVQGGDVLVEV